MRFAPIALLVASACAVSACSVTTTRYTFEEEGPDGSGPFELERYLNVRGNSFSGFRHDGEFLYFLSATTGTAQVWRLGRDGWPYQVTAFADRVQSATPSPTDEVLLIARDVGGNENSQLVLVSTTGTIVRDLTNAPDVKHDFGGWSWDGKRIAWSSNARTQKAVLAWRAAKKAGTATGDEPPTSTDVYVCDVATGKAERVFEAKPGELFGAMGFSPDGTRLLLSRANGSIDNDLFVLDLATRQTKHLTPHKDVVSYSADWSADGKKLWVVTNEGTEHYGLSLWDVASGTRTAVRTPKAEVELATASRDGRFVAVGTAKNGGREIEVIDATTFATVRVLPTGPGIPGGIDFFPGADFVGYTMNGPLTPSDVYTCSLGVEPPLRKTRAFLAGIPRSSFVVPETVRYTSFDGLEIEALLWRPKGATKLPTIVEFHGGPESQSRPGFNSLAQYFVSRGFAFFQPNVRGSTGYGRTFTHLDDVRLREDSVKDGVASVEWLKKSGVADPSRVVAMGGSYGGYMVLAALTKNPDLWAAGVDIVGIANFVTFLENTSGYRRKLRESEYGFAGSESAPGPDREFLKSISPLAKIESIRVPLLVIHGEQDPRVPVGEARQVEAALKGLGRPVEALYYPDEGHGIAKLKNRLDCYPKIVDFLNRVLKK